MKTKLFFGEKKHAIREAGLRTERKFFGKRGIFVKAGHVGHLTKRKQNPQYRGPLTWAMIVQYVGQDGWKPISKKNVAVFHRTVGKDLDQSLQLEARAWRVFYRTALYGVSKVVHSLGAYEHLDQALIAANRQASDYLREIKKNPITLVGNPPKRITTDVAGVMYNKVWEIQAEKTGTKHKGLWYHPFKGRSRVQMLALDTGDILIHSTAGKKLWMEA